jgi:hypothetical protein
VTDWFRSWHGAPTDPKWLLIARKAGVKPCHVAHVFWALLDHGSQNGDRGFVGDFDIETFALFAGLEEEHVSRIVTQLREKGLVTRENRLASWGKRQPKREDETAAERKRRSRSDNGGNSPKPDAPDPERKSSRHATSHNVTIDKSREEKKSSDTSVSGTVVPHPAADFCKVVFDSGVSLLIASGRSDHAARSLIGRWRQALGDPELLTLIRQSEVEGHSDPAAWLTAAVKTRNGTRERFDQSSRTADALQKAFGGS